MNMMVSRWWLLVPLLVAILGVSFADWLHARSQEYEQPQEPPKVDVTLPEFVVIYDYPSEPPLNLRMIVRARSEGEAVMRSMISLFKNFHNSLDLDKLRFLEVAPKRDPDKKK